MKRTGYTRLYLYFYSDCGDIAVTYLNPVPGLTKKSLRPLIERLLETYRTRRGVRPKYFKRASVVTHGETALV